MGKGTPHCELTVARQLVAVGASALRLSFSDMLDVVLALRPADFHKSMTTHADSSVWQDVYRPATKAAAVYLKLTVIDDVLIVH